MVTKSPPSRLRDSGIAADLILDCADEALREHGYKGMTMEDVANRAGLGKGTLYLYFQSKEEVALSVIDRNNRRLQERLKTIAKDRESCTERLYLMIVERIMFRFDCAQGHRKGVDDLLVMLRPQLHERREKYHRTESLIIAEVLIEGRTRGEFFLEDPFDVADAMITATASLLPYSLSPAQLGERNELLRRTRFLANLLLASIQAPSADRALLGADASNECSLHARKSLT